MTVGVMVHKIFKDKNGFTFIEIIAVLIIIGILSAIAISRSVSYDTEVYTGADVLKSHLRYAQTMAMNSSTSVAQTSICGIKSGGTSYWLFLGTDPDNNIMRLPEDDAFIDANRTINLTKKKIKFANTFTIYFDNHGIPYTAYASATSNTPLAAPLTINVQPLNTAAPNIAVTVTPFTGYIK